MEEQNTDENFELLLKYLWLFQLNVYYSCINSILCWH